MNNLEGHSMSSPLLPFSKVPAMLPCTISVFGSIKSPRIPVTIERQKVTVLSGTGVEVSVLPKPLMNRVIGNGSRREQGCPVKRSTMPFSNSVATYRKNLAL